MELQEFIKKIANQFEDSEFVNINEAVDFKKLETWDSLTSLSIQVMVQDEYNVKVTPEDLKETKTLLDLFNFVKRKNSDND